MNESQTEIRGSYRPPVPGSRRVGTPGTDEMITVTVTVRGPAPPDADAHPAPVLSRSEFEALFGARQDDIDQVRDVLGRRGGASGGGISTVFPRPQWQDVRVEPPVASDFDGRIVPDVAAIASVRGYQMIFNGTPARSGGTSAAAPVWAALITRAAAAAGGGQRFLTPVLYRPSPEGKPLGRAVRNDITIGMNVSEPQPGIGYSAQPGYDAVTAWGTPDGIALTEALKALRLSEDSKPKDGN